VTSTRPRHLDGLAVYESTGPANGPHVVLVHGSMDRAAAFRKAVRHLRDVDVTLYDRRGYARSLDAGTADTIDQLVADLLTVVDRRPTVVVGHSLGAVIALSAASRAPELITAVGAFEAPMGWRPWWPSTSAGGFARETAAVEGPEAAAEQFMRRLVGDDRWENLPEGTRRQRRAEGPALLADLAAMRSGGAPFDAASIGVPVVAGYGSVTSDRHQRATRELADEVPDCELTTIDDAPHGAHYSHPEQFAFFVRQTLARTA
jgi:pimeloyl-ACP methyl ester carboxylesterase